jgi:multidrug efflux pump subunit AcrA (membrane-fusion protein)
VKFLGMIMGLGSLATFFIVPAYKTFTYLSIEPELHRKRGLAWAWTGAFAAIALVVLGFIRFPQNVRAEAFLRPWDRASIYPTTPGFIEQIAKRDGEQVTKGEPLVILRNDDLRSEIKRLTALVSGLEVQLRASQTDDPVSARSVAQELEVQRSELTRASERMEELTIRSPIDGQFIAPTIDQQQGRFVAPGDPTPLAIVARTEKLIGYAVINQGEIELIRSAQRKAGATPQSREEAKGYRTEVRLVSDVGWTMAKDNKPIVPIQTALAPAGTRDVRAAALTQQGGGEFQADPRDPSGRRLAQEEFEFQVTLNNPTGRLHPDQRAYVRIQLDKGSSLVTQGWRRLNQLIQTTKTS